MLTEDKLLYVAHSDKPLCIIPRMGNRHGLIAGATGTGKTVSLQVIAESFSAIGVPVFMADMKGDLSGIAKAGVPNKFIAKREEEIGVKFDFRGFPARFFDVYGELGHPLRTTVSEMGPLLLSQLLELNDTQEGVLNIVFRLADDKGLLLLDLKDLRAMLTYVGEHAGELTTAYGNVSAASVGAIRRALLRLEEQGGELFFGEPAFNIFDFIQTEGGSGVINILAAEKLVNAPKLYATFLLWLLSSLYEELPEVGDMDKPKFVFFFDEAHLLFNDAPKILLDKIEQIVRLVRSKGVGIYFITQNPQDVPDSILGQLGNRIQHALRAFTPRDQKAVKVAASTFRTNPSFDTEEVITALATGEALVSFLDDSGAPCVVERAKMLCPESQIGPITAEERKALIGSSPIYGVYEKLVDRESAYEILQGRAAEAQKAKEAEEQAKARAKADAETQKAAEAARKAEEKAARTSASQARKSGTSATEKVVTSVLTSIGRTIGTTVVRSILGTWLKKK